MWRSAEGAGKEGRREGAGREGERMEGGGRERTGGGKELREDRRRGQGGREGEKRMGENVGRVGEDGVKVDGKVRKGRKGWD